MDESMPDPRPSLIRPPFRPDLDDRATIRQGAMSGDPTDIRPPSGLVNPANAFLPDGAAAPLASYFLGSRRRVDDAATSPDAIDSGDETADWVAGPAPSTNTLSGPGSAPIGRYRPIRILGQGAFGIVLLAFDDQLRREVAVKLPRRPRIAEEAEVLDFLGEARTLASLDHPHIVPIYDLGRDDAGRCYVVSKFLKGGDLKSALESRGPYDSRTAAELISRVAQALNHAHRGGLIHRDIKPANILLDEAGSPYVADFGLALKSEDIQAGSGIAGTPAYMSPEQIAGDSEALDGRSDLFSLGIVLYELLTGERPFRGANLAALVDRIRHADPIPPHLIRPGLSLTLSNLCMACLAKSPDDRFLNCGVFAQALERWLEHGDQAEPDRKPDPGPDDSATTVTARVAVVTAMIGGVVVGGLVAAFAWWNMNRYDRAATSDPGKSIFAVSPPAVPATPTVIYRDREVLVPVADDPPPLGFSESTWRVLPESAKSALREHRTGLDRDPLGRYRPSDPFDRYRPSDPFDPIGGATRIPGQSMTNPPGYSPFDNRPYPGRSPRSRGPW